LNAYSVFATSHDPAIIALYRSYLERESLRKKEKMNEQKIHQLKKIQNQIFKPILTDFYSGRFLKKKEIKN